MGRMGADLARLACQIFEVVGKRLEGGIDMVEHEVQNFFNVQC